MLGKGSGPAPFSSAPPSTPANRIPRQLARVFGLWMAPRAKALPCSNADRR